MQAGHFDFIQLVSTSFWLIVILVLAFIKRSRHADEPHYRFFWWNVGAKLFFSLAFSIFYIVIYKGGDTVAYFDGAVTLNNLFLKSPTLYFEQLFSPPDTLSYFRYFDASTGFPPSWIYKEPEGFFVCKILSFFSFLSLRSFLAMTFILAYAVSLVSWKLFEVVRSLNIASDRSLAIGILLLPSVNFWCSGISKDTFVLGGILTIVYQCFKIIQGPKRYFVLRALIILVSSWVVYAIRDIFLYATIAALAAAFATLFVKKINGGRNATILLRTLFIAGGIALIGGNIISQTEEDFLKQNSFIERAAIIQRDFSTNETYGSNKYSLGDIEYSPIGLLKVTPIAILSGLYRPFIWESLSPSLILNGLESILFIILTFRFFRRDWKIKIRFIQQSEFLIFCVIFILIVGFMTGLTSGLFGVLVRLRAPLLPFLVILLALSPQHFNLEREDKKVLKASSIPT